MDLSTQLPKFARIEEACVRWVPERSTEYNDMLDLLKGKNGRLHIEHGVDPIKITDEWLARQECKKHTHSRKVHWVSKTLVKSHRDGSLNVDGIDIGDSLVAPASLGVFLLSLIARGFKSHKIVQTSNGRMFVIFQNYVGLSGIYENMVKKYRCRDGMIPATGKHIYLEREKSGGTSSMESRSRALTPLEKLSKKEIAAQHFLDSWKPSS